MLIGVGNSEIMHNFIQKRDGTHCYRTTIGDANEVNTRIIIKLVMDRVCVQYSGINF